MALPPPDAGRPRHGSAAAHWPVDWSVAGSAVRHYGCRSPRAAAPGAETTSACHASWCLPPRLHPPCHGRCRVGARVPACRGRCAPSLRQCRSLRRASADVGHLLMYRVDPVTAPTSPSREVGISPVIDISRPSAVSPNQTRVLAALKKPAGACPRVRRACQPGQSRR